jgi:hypothetical protein
MRARDSGHGSGVGGQSSKEIRKTDLPSLWLSDLVVSIFLEPRVGKLR